MRQHTMVSGTAVLAFAAIINRIVGLAFRAYLVRTFGQEATGLYQMAFPLYVSVMTVSTAGISIGVARLVASHRQRGDEAGVNSAFKAGWRLAVLGGIAGMILLVVSSRTLAFSLLFGVAEAGQLLSSMGWVAWMIYLQHITTATLQGLGKPAVPTRNAAICTILSSLVIVAGTYARPELGIHIAVFAVVVGIGSGATLGLLEVIRILGGLRAIVSLLLRGGLAGALALFVTDTALMSYGGPLFFSLMLAAVVTALTFFPLAWLLGLMESLHR